MFARRTTDECAPTVTETARICDMVAVGQRAQPGVPLLIHGEPGTGKDTLACLIHAASSRRAHAFIKVNLAAPSADDHAAELFGHERGSTPQATRRRLGSFEFANHGTLYLDGVGAARAEHIARVIRAARLGEVARNGSEETIRLDVRLIASTPDSATVRADNDLWQALRNLDAVEICVPPLRERADEIPILVSFFLERFNRRYRRDVQVCSDLMSSFVTRAWPGNIRELEEAIRRFFVSEATVSVP